MLLSIIIVKDICDKTPFSFGLIKHSSNDISSTQNTVQIPKLNF